VKPVEPRWHESGAVLVCEKCYKTRIPEELPELAERIGDFNLREWLKARCKEAGLGKRVRVIGTTCQDVCGIGVTVTILPTGSHGETRTFEIDPLDDREAILQRILTTLALEE
jgi:predicted metal-binding protein